MKMSQTNVQEVWGEFTLKVVPVDEFGNPSVKVFKDFPEEPTVADSLKLLDANVEKAANLNKVHSRLHRWN